MTQRHYILLAAGGSLALLAGAFLFQALGYAPCKMCLWQRWPHVAAVALGIGALVIPSRFICWLGALAAATTAVIGAYHSGVELKWWEGPSSCSGGGGLGNLSGADLISTDFTAKIVMCDEVAWAFLGLSMASWNMVFSLILVLLWIKAART